MIGNTVQDRLWVHLFNHDPSMAPEGKTSLTIMINGDYEYWKKLSEVEQEYEKKRHRNSQIVTRLLEQRFPGISSQVEMTDIATPLTFERYTGNWKGSFEGWQITPENSNVLMKPMSQKLARTEQFLYVRPVGRTGRWIADRCNVGTETGKINLQGRREEIKNDYKLME